jgi:hypothetical protein
MPLEHTPAHIIQAHLLTVSGLGVNPATNRRDDWPIYRSRMPEAVEIKDNAIAVVDTGGTTDGRLHQTGETVEHPGIQISVRAKNEQVGFLKATSLAAALDNIRRVIIDIDGVEYKIQSANRTSPVLSLGQEVEKTRRWMFSLNAILTITKED